MSVQEVARWAVICDRCGSPIYASSWLSKADAETVARGASARGDQHFCHRCWPHVAGGDQ